jgi:hypothetical protein
MTQGTRATFAAVSVIPWCFMHELRASSLKHGILWFVPILLLWGVVILPSSFHAVWGSLDDGGTLLNAHKGFFASFNTKAGRIIPVYYLHNWLLYILAGTNPTVWYIIQSLEFLLAALLTYAAVASLSHHWWAATLASAVLLTSSPISENAYTVSKNEPRLAVLLAFMALLLSVILRRTFRGRATQTEGVFTGLLWLTLTLTILMAVFAKESAISLAALGPTGVFFSRLCMPESRRSLAVKVFLFVSLLLFSAGALLVGLKIVLLAGTEHAYTTFALSADLALSNLASYLTQGPDVLIIIASCAALGVIRFVVGRRVPRGTQTREGCDIQAVMGFTYLITAVAYLFVLLLWRWPMNYYLLPVAVCISLSLGHLVTASGVAGVPFNTSRERFCAIALVIIACGTRLYSIPYLHFVATAQRGFDAIENQASRELVHLNPIQRRVIDVERPSFSEQPFQRNLLYQISGNPSFAWVGGGDLLQEYPETEKRLYDLSKPPPWQSRPPGTGDLFLVQASEYPFGIHLRGVGPNGLPLALWTPKIDILRKRTGLSLVEVRRWQSQWNVYEPWTLRRRKLVLRTAIYQAIMQPG